MIGYFVFSFRAENGTAINFVKSIFEEREGILRRQK